MKDRYLKKLIWRKSMFLKNPVKRNWSYKSMAWESFSSPSAAFLKMWNHFMDLETVCHVVVKLPVLPKACVIPCWEKPGERENVISDCLWATVWENEVFFKPMGQAGRIWAGEESQSSRATAGPRVALSDVSFSALRTSRCYRQAGSRAVLHF